MPSTASTVPSSVRNSTWRSSTSSTGSAIGQLDVECVADRLAEKDEGADEEAEEQRREEQQGWRRAEPCLRDLALESPRDRRQPQPDTEEGEGGLARDRAADDVRGEHQDGRDPVG